ncbi:MAG: class I SAM-dependent methyltransferase [Acidobacteriota bacterium]
MTRADAAITGPSLVAKIGCDFWDGHHHISEDPEFWLAHPSCRAAVNRRVSGQAGVYPLDHLYASAGRPRFRKALSLGCGTGRLERAMARYGVTDEIDAIDGSPVSIGIAREKALEENLLTIHYEVADLNRVQLTRRAYDAVIFHASLHHVTSVEKLLERVLVSLKPSGLLFLDEWTGPSRFEWSDAKLARAAALFAAIPRGWRKWPELRAPIEVDDPSEAVRSSAILPAVHRLFSVHLERPYGGHLVSVLLPQLDRSLIPPGELDAMISTWLIIEEANLTGDPSASYHTALLASPRRGPGRIAGRLASLAVRARLGVRYRVLAPMGLGMRGREPN